MHLPAVKQIFNWAKTTVAVCVALNLRDWLAPGGVGHLRDIASLTTGTGPASLLAAAVALTVVNKALLVGLLGRVSPSTPRREHLGDRESWMLDGVDAAGGIVLAAAWVLSPWFFPVALAPVLLGQRSAVHRHLVEKAQTDAKTGVATPTHWRTVADRAVTRARHASGGTLGVLMVDLDHFKQLNDCHGHLAGDEVLTAVADTLRLAVRPGDLVGRFGGEEFVILVVDADLDDTTHVAARIQQRLDLIGGRSGTPGDGITVTASIGVAVYGYHGIDLDQLLRAADQGLYTAKTAGRDRVGIAPPHSTDLRSVAENERGSQGLGFRLPL